MKNKKSWIILGALILIAASFIYLNFFSKKTEKEEGVPNSYSTILGEGELSAVYGQELAFQLKNEPSVQKVMVYLDDSLTWSKSEPKAEETVKISLKNLTLGTHKVRIEALASNDNRSILERDVQVLSDLVPQNWPLTILQKLPHNDSLFTEGLCFYNGKLFEGTGDGQYKGETMVGEINVDNGKVLRRVKRSAPIFGEGVTVFNGELFQLTWKDHVCYVYDEKTLKSLREINYSGEGWGLTHNGKQLIQSDGTERLYFRDPKSFSIQKTIQVFDNKGPVTKLNELEYIAGYVYANIWTTNQVVVIEPSTGKVIAYINADILAKEGKGNGDVLNGIAFNSVNNKLYMTGKNWPVMFEVKIDILSKAVQ
jgi:glutaminyl-peptide cyclotransferase